MGIETVNVPIYEYGYYSARNNIKDSLDIKLIPINFVTEVCETLPFIHFYKIKTFKSYRIEYNNQLLNYVVHYYPYENVDYNKTPDADYAWAVSLFSENRIIRFVFHHKLIDLLTRLMERYINKTDLCV